MEHSLSARLQPLAEADVDYFKLLTNTSEGWEESYNASGTVVESRKSPGTNIYMFRVTSTFKDSSPTTIFDLIQDPEYNAVNNNYSGCMVCYLDDQNSLEYYYITCPFPLYDRDLVIQKTCIPSHGDYMIIYHSVEVDLFPVTDKSVRAHTFITGYRIRAVPGGSFLTYLTHFDPKGYIPSFLINQMTKRTVPNTLKVMYDSILSYEAWKKDHNPDHKPWRIPKQRDQCLYAKRENLLRWGFLPETKKSGPVTLSRRHSF